MDDNNSIRVPRKRFFLCTFSGLDSEDELRTGKVMCKTTTGKHISELFVIKLITKDFNLRSVFVTHVNEMSEPDFNDFSKGMEDLGSTGDEEATFL